MDPKTGGTCQVIRNIIPELEKQGVYNKIVCLNDPTEVFLTNDTFTICALGPCKSQWQYSPELIPWLSKNLSQFDVILVHGLWLFISYAVWKVTRQAKNPPAYFIMPHGMLDPYFQQAESRKLKALRNWIYWKSIEHKVIEDAAGLLFTSQTELLLARQTFRPYSPKREINVGYGIPNPPSFSTAMQTAFSQKCPTLGKDPYLLFLSRINYKKGIDLLIKAYAALLEEQPDTEALPSIVIAGPGLDSPYGQQMEQLVSEMPLIRKRVFFPGMLSGIIKWGALYGCDAFILPSHQENFGIAVVEALSCSKPVLISDQINIWQEIEGGGIVNNNTIEGTKLLLKQWINTSATEKDAMRIAARQIYEKKFTIYQTANCLFDIIKIYQSQKI